VPRAEVHEAAARAMGAVVTRVRRVNAVADCGMMFLFSAGSGFTAVNDAMIKASELRRIELYQERSPNSMKALNRDSSKTRSRPSADWSIPHSRNRLRKNPTRDLVVPTIAASSSWVMRSRN
jgi:hypothetical protein